MNFPKLYIGTQNDGLFIIDQPPRPSNDDINPNQGAKVFASLREASREAQAIVERMVASYNASLSEHKGRPNNEPAPAKDDGWVQVDETHPLPGNLKFGDEVRIKLAPVVDGDFPGRPTHYRRRSQE